MASSRLARPFRSLFQQFVLSANVLHKIINVKRGIDCGRSRKSEGRHTRKATREGTKKRR